MPKKIITHINPDLDAVTSCWLIKRFLPGWEEAEIGFVEATISEKKTAGVDEDQDTLYVDVGRGKLDHHQTSEYLSATKLCWEFILKNRRGYPFRNLEKGAIERLVEIVTEIDNASDLKWKEIVEDRYYFYLHTLIDGLRGIGKTDQEVVEFSFQALDSVLLNLKNKIKSEEELKNGEEFETKWGRGIALESGNKQVLWQGEARGFVMVVKKNPKSGAIQIYSRPDSKVDLTEVYKKFKELDPGADWFLHASKKLLLNESSVNPKMKPTKLTLEQIVSIIKNER